jgi:hypothetical protein
MGRGKVRFPEPIKCGVVKNLIKNASANKYKSTIISRRFNRHTLYFNFGQKNDYFLAAAPQIKATQTLQLFPVQHLIRKFHQKLSNSQD